MRGEGRRKTFHLFFLWNLEEFRFLTRCSKFSCNISGKRKLIGQILCVIISFTPPVHKPRLRIKIDNYTYNKNNKFITPTTNSS
jgi:hypothetical protein